jgi:formyltetrahydrofolate-dependent phosphoribosylglycinamide formyltransferase
MFQKLQTKWKVNGWQLALIIITFALGGSACGFVGKKIMNLTGLDKGFIWFIIYILILTIIWPVCVLVISIFTGQFSFFKKYIAKIFSRFGGKKKIDHPVIRLAIFASGAGSNAAKIIEYFKGNPDIQVSLIVCNKPGAGVLKIAQQAGIDTLIIEKASFEAGDTYIKELRVRNIDWLILAGFLWKVPDTFIKEWKSKIINIHPALLPGYGGKGMYGSRVHEAIITAGDKESGITIHYVDEVYDNGEIIFQARCPVGGSDNAETLAQKIHALEHAHYPTIIEQEIKKQKGS